MLTVACTAAPATRTGPTDAQPAAQVGRKAITIALEGEINALATDLNASSVSGLTSYLHAFIHNTMTMEDDEDEVRPLLATELPSLEAGTWKVFDDGRMEVTWRLHRGVLWHDGTEFTSADVRFGWQVAADPVALGRSSLTLRQMQDVTAPDPYTVVVHWRETSRFGGEMGRTQMTPLPRHILEPAFLADTSTFAAQPYFSDHEALVGNGAYRLLTWERGSHATVEAFDRYYGGRPKIDRVTFRFIPDPRTTMANVLSGAVDIAYRGIGYDEAVFIQQEWAKSDGGTVQNAPTNYRHILFQMRPEMAVPRDLLNVQVRRALMYGANREDMVQAVFPGVGPEMVADGIGWPGSANGDAVRQSVARYAYDPTRAAALLDSVGWRRGGDGILVKATGERFDMELRSSGTSEFERIFTLMKRDYGQLGIELSLLSFGGRIQDPSIQAYFPGMLQTGFPFNFPTFGNRWQSRNVDGPENRFSGGNRSGYINPALDTVLDNLERAIRPQDEARLYGDAWRILTEEMAVMSLYFVPQSVAVRKGITGALPKNPSGLPTWRVQTWDVV